MRCARPACHHHAAGAGGATASRGNDYEITLVVTGAEPLAFQWFKDGVPLADGDSISGAQSPSLTIINPTVQDIGVYDVVISNSEGATLSEPATIAVRPPACPADVYGSGEADAFDLFQFLDTLDDGCPTP